ncbi:AraC family transcriptional regulator [Oxalobacteraceae bacterium A2-2]
MRRDPTPSTLDRMVDLAAGRLPQDGRSGTSIPFLSLIRSSRVTPVSRGVLKPSCCVILQGGKQVQLADEVLHYGPGEFLVVTVDMPAAGSIVNASPDQPYLLINVELDPNEIAAVVLEAKIDLSRPGEPVRGAFVGRADESMLDLLHKLLRLLDAPAAEAAFLAVGLKRELLYRLLAGPYGPQLYQNVVLDQQDQGISKAIAWLKENYARTVRVEELAAATNMSVSSLHHRFKAVTTMGPLQYQKQLRLQQARLLLLNGAADASTAAYSVGYESPSQFSREYRRLFGAPPMQDVKQLRGQMQDRANIVQETP